jgi:hypothetical protein
MLEAIDVLKGVLGFDESLSSKSRGGISPSSTTAIEPLEPPPPIRDSTSVSPRNKPPPPLPSRSYLQEGRNSRPSLPTIASASVINRQRGSGGRTATGDDGSIGPLSPPTPHDELQIVLDDDIDEEGDTFADPTPTRATKHSKGTGSPSRPVVPPRKRNLGSQSSGGDDIVNRTISHMVTGGKEPRAVWGELFPKHPPPLHGHYWFQATLRMVGAVSVLGRLGKVFFTLQAKKVV